jgi:antitoxin CptB
VLDRKGIGGGFRAENLLVLGARRASRKRQGGKAMTETHEARLGRLRTRSMWRGIREMDIILRDFSSRELVSMGPDDLDLYESLLTESDHDLLAWITGAAEPPAPLAPLIARIRAGAVGLTRPD